MHYTVRTREGGKHGVLIPLHARILEKFIHHVYFKQFSSCMRGFDDFLRFSRKEKNSRVTYTSGCKKRFTLVHNFAYNARLSGEIHALITRLL